MADSKTIIAKNNATINNNIIGDTNTSEGDYLAAAGQIVNSQALPMVLKAAVDLDLLRIIANAGPGRQLSAAEIAAQLATRNPDAPVMLDRMLRLLATHSVVSCSVDDPARTGEGGGSVRRYGLGPISKYFVPSEPDGVCLTPLVALQLDNVFLASWSKLKDAVLEGGIPFNMVHGVHAFEYPGLNPRFNEVFNKAMFNFTTIAMKEILQIYNGFEGIQQLVDVGGGLGHSLHVITSKYPSIKGINFDLPHVITNALPYPGVKHVGGDMFESVPRGDAIFMKWILHDWSDDHCKKLLKNVYKAVPKNGKVIIVESIVTEEPQTTIVAKAISQMDVDMLTQNPGGKERTLKEFLTLATLAGFSHVNVICRVSHFWVMEFYKYGIP